MSTSVRASAVAVLATCFVMNMLARGASETFAVYLLALAQFWIVPALRTGTRR